MLKGRNMVNTQTTVFAYQARSWKISDIENKNLKAILKEIILFTAEMLLFFICFVMYFFFSKKKFNLVIPLK